MTPTAQTQHAVLLYGDVNLDIIDGSAIWLVSLARALAQADVEVHVILKNTPRKDRLIQDLRGRSRIILHDPGSGVRSKSNMLSHSELATRLEEVDQQIGGATAIIVRGFDACETVSKSPVLSGKLWSYVTDLPHPLVTASPNKVDALNELAKRSRRMFAQTPQAQAYLEAVAPASAGKTVLLNPMVPDEAFQEIRAEQLAGAYKTPLDLVYSGKFHPDWRTLEMCQLPELAREIGLDIKLTVAGDKFHQVDPTGEWQMEMHRALSAPGVHWVGGVSREEVTALNREADIGLSWRSASMNESLELSTKVLEYAAVGTPPLLNRTPAHEALFGADYPLFVDKDDPNAVVATLVAAKDKLPELKQRVQDAVRYYSVSASGQRLRAALDNACAEPSNAPQQPTTVLVAGHDLKFMADIVESFEQSRNINLIFDEWKTLHAHDEQYSQTQLAQADVVFCEWAGKNALWYSHHKKPGQRVVVRLHGFEVRAAWLTDINISQVDAVIVVSEHMRRRVLDKTDWPEEKIHVIPNSVQTWDLDRPKLPGHRYRIGLVGIVPFLKRPDRALEFFRELISTDDRYALHIRGRLPWEYRHVWADEEARKNYEQFFEQIGEDPALGQRISFEPFGADMGSWYRKIGFILSPSDNESFHLAPAEAMVSGTVPLVWEREGARDVFSDAFVYTDSTTIAQAVLAINASDDSFQEQSAAARDYARRWDTRVVNEQVHRLLFEGR